MKVKPPNTYVASDYAGLTTERVKAYYGYEKTTSTELKPSLLEQWQADGKEEEWCFVATIHNEHGHEYVRVVAPYSRLWEHLPKKAWPGQFEPLPSLVQGLGWLLTKFKLTEREE